MYQLRLTSVAIVCGLVMFVSAARTQATTTPAFSLDGTGNETSGITTRSVGYTFTTTQPLTVVALGTYDSAGTTIASTSGLQVFLYDDGASPGTVLASATVLGTDPATSLSGGAYTTGDAFRYHSITPLVLPAGNYEIMTGTNGLDINFRYNAGNTALTGVTLTHAAYTFAGPPYYSTLYFDPNIPGDFGPNFLTAVPEPNSLLMFSSAFSALAMVARGRRRES